MMAPQWLDRDYGDGYAWRILLTDLGHSLAIVLAIAFCFILVTGSY